MGQSSGKPSVPGPDGHQEGLYCAGVYFFSGVLLPAARPGWYAPQFMSIKVWGNLNLAYLFALSQFFMAWTIAGLYVRAGDNFDQISKDIIEEALEHENSKGDK
jgi:uncharacterized membrane protein (DUF485 family)